MTERRSMADYLAEFIRERIVIFFPGEEVGLAGTLTDVFSDGIKVLPEVPFLG